MFNLYFKFKNRFKPRFRRLYTAVLIIIYATNPQSVQHLIWQTPFMRIVWNHRHHYYRFDYDERHTVVVILEQTLHFATWYVYRYIMYVSKPFRFIYKKIKKNEVLSFLCSAVLIILSVGYFLILVAPVTQQDYLKAFLIENNLSLLVVLIVISFICLVFLKKSAMQRLLSYFDEYKHLDLFIGFIVWTALVRFFVSTIYINVVTSGETPISVLAWIFFPFFVLTVFMLSISFIFWLTHYSTRYIKTKGLSLYEKKLYRGRKYSDSRIFGFYSLWLLALYWCVWFAHKFFYSYIALDHITPGKAFLIYICLFILSMFILPRWWKMLFEVVKRARVPYQRRILKNLFLFTGSSYLIIFYSHKFYYMSFLEYAFNFSALTFGILILLSFILIVVCCINRHFIKLIRTLTFFTTSSVYFLSLFYWIYFDRSSPKFQFVIDLATQSVLGLDIIFGVDGISLFFILLTTLISPLLVLITWTLDKDIKLLSAIILITELLTLLTFLALDLFLFYIAFEAILIPLFISIIIWGSRRRKIKAGKMLFIYTLLSSMLFLIALFTLYCEIGTTNFFALVTYCSVALSITKQKFLWVLLFIAFGIKVPLYPLHTWLPEAHVEAPTFGSVILASLLLKTGGYGLFRFVLPLFPQATMYFSPLVFMLALMGVLYAALASIRQIDMKRIIAYLSVSHMNLCVLGQFSETLEGLMGSLLLMAAHGLIAAGFFISVGVIYDRYHTRLIYYYGGLARTMPLFALILFIFVLGNMNMPGTSNFVGELLILVSIGYKGFVLCLLAAIGSAIGALCTIWFWNRLMFGALKLKHLNKFHDVTRREMAILLPLVLFNFVIGIFTNELVDTSYVSIYFLYSCLI